MAGYKGKDYYYKGKPYKLGELAALTPRCVTKTSLSQRLCSGKFPSIESAVDTPFMPKSVAGRVRRPNLNPSAKVTEKIYVLFWSPTSTTLSDVRHC